MSKIDPVHDLVLLVRSGHQLLHIDTEEEERVSALLLHVADRVDQPLFAWTRVRGLGRVDLPGTVYDTESPAKAFRHVTASDQPGLYHFKDLAPHLNQDAVLAAQMKEAAETLRGTRRLGVASRARAAPTRSSRSCSDIRAIEKVRSRDLHRPWRACGSSFPESSTPIPRHGA